MDGVVPPLDPLAEERYTEWLDHLARRRHEETER